MGNHKKAGSHILKKSIPALIKASTYGLLDFENVVKDELPKMMEGLTKDLIAEYAKDKEAITNLKSGVSEILRSNGNVAIH